jgi:hypothetical protein
LVPTVEQGLLEYRGGLAKVVVVLVKIERLEALDAT